jgi:hypothetical protein
MRMASLQRFPHQNDQKLEILKRAGKPGYEPNAKWCCRSFYEDSAHQFISCVVADTAPPNTLERLENAFKRSLLVVAGDLNTVATHAEKLRLAVTTEECAVVLDHLTVEITIDQVEEAINSLFPDRFVEP